jgi:hypothetical protein
MNADRENIKRFMSQIKESMQPSGLVSKLEKGSLQGSERSTVNIYSRYMKNEACEGLAAKQPEIIHLEMAYQMATVTLLHEIKSDCKLVPELVLLRTTRDVKVYLPVVVKLFHCSKINVTHEVEKIKRNVGHVGILLFKPSNVGYGWWASDETMGWIGEDNDAQRPLKERKLRSVCEFLSESRAVIFQAALENDLIPNRMLDTILEDPLVEMNDGPNQLNYVSVDPPPFTVRSVLKRSSNVEGKS